MNRKLLFFGIAILLAMVTGDLIIKQSSSSTTSGLNFSASELSKVISKKKTKQVWESDKKNDAVDTTALKQSNWYAEVMKNIESSEYEISGNNKTGNFYAPNHKQQLNASFAYNGFVLQPINKKGWELSMQLSGIYADDKLIAKPASIDLPVKERNKIIFNNTCFTTEYLNCEEGVRQNFIIKKSLKTIKPRH